MKENKMSSLVELPDAIETMVDTHGIACVIDALSGVCHAKAEHLSNSWQDEPTAEVWSRLGALLGKRPYAAAIVIAEHYGQKTGVA